jgi:hypothetical protein
VNELLASASMICCPDVDASRTGYASNGEDGNSGSDGFASDGSGSADDYESGWSDSDNEGWSGSESESGSDSDSDSAQHQPAPPRQYNSQPFNLHSLFGQPAKQPAVQVNTSEDVGASRGEQDRRCRQLLGL